MVIGTLALLWYFVMVAVIGAEQWLRRELEELKSCRTGGICNPSIYLSIHPSIRPSICLSVPPPQAPQRLTQAPQRLTQASQRLTQVSQRLAQASQRLALSWEDRSLGIGKKFMIQLNFLKN